MEKARTDNQVEELADFCLKSEAFCHFQGVKAGCVSVDERGKEKRNIRCASSKSVAGGAKLKKGSGRGRVIYIRAFSFQHFLSRRRHQVKQLSFWNLREPSSAQNLRRQQCRALLHDPSHLRGYVENRAH